MDNWFTVEQIDRNRFKAAVAGSTLHCKLLPADKFYKIQRYLSG